MAGSNIRRLLSAVSTLDSRLPYNWNWQRDWAELAPFLEANPILLMDVGARGEAPPELDSMARFIRRVGFEPDPDECSRLNADGSGLFFPVVVSGSSGRERLHLYEDAGYSSTLTVSKRYERLWTGPLPILRTIEAESVTIDGFLQEMPSLSPDILKLDTQGSELSVLEGAKATLAKVGLVEVEVEFFPIYDNQPLFGDVAAYLAEEDFDLLYLNRVLVSRREVYKGPCRGQVLYADALFGKREDALDTLTAEECAKYAILLCQYGHMDVAWQLLQDLPELDVLVPRLRSVFRGHASRPVRAALMQVDKLLALGLHLRRYNQRGTDCDRCWPIR